VTPVTVTAAAEQTIPTVVVPVTPSAKIGESLPALDLKDAEGKAIDLATFRGRYLLLHGWAGWCAACARDYPGLRRLRADIAAEKLALVGLNLDADAATVGKRAAKNAFAWPHAWLGGPGGSAAERLRVGAIPLYVVVAPDGKLAFRGADWSEVERFLRGKLGK
jgi:hypothetical protein